MKYLDFYYDCMDSGSLPDQGLCRCFRHDENFELFHPTLQNNKDFGPWDDDSTSWYWGYNGLCINEEMPETDDREMAFTPLRQTIVLFLAAMNNEL